MFNSRDVYKIFLFSANFALRGEKYISAIKNPVIQSSIKPKILVHGVSMIFPERIMNGKFNIKKMMKIIRPIFWNLYNLYNPQGCIVKKIIKNIIKYSQEISSTGFTYFN
jgi:hypothetical protein